MLRHPAALSLPVNTSFANMTHGSSCLNKHDIHSTLGFSQMREEQALLLASWNEDAGSTAFQLHVCTLDWLQR